MAFSLQPDLNKKRFHLSINLTHPSEYKSEGRAAALSNSVSGTQTCDFDTDINVKLNYD